MDLLQQQPAPQPPATQKPPVEPELKRRPLVPLSFANGTLKKHRPVYRPASPPHYNNGGHVVYRECMKNHAASLGGHALDGCGEFMPSSDATPADPASLLCAACGCHRNFHRRLLHSGAADHHHHHSHLHREEREVDDGAAAAEEEDGDEAVDDDGEGHSSPPPQQSQGSHQYFSAPHMLMALSTGLPGGPVGSPGHVPLTAGPASTATRVAGGMNLAVIGSVLPRKRFRTKFSPEQKERMHELSERLGWRMQKRDDALVEQCCREIGVSRGVFKVWMHNNKHNFVGGPSSRRAGGGAGSGGGGGGGGGGGEGTSSSGGVAGGGVGGVGANGGDERNGVGGGGASDDRNGGGGGHVLNSSSSPSS